MNEPKPIRIHPLRCGSIRVSPDMPYGGELSLKKSADMVFCPADKRIVLPVYSFLIEHPKGRLLLDCGWCREISPEGHYDAGAVRRILPAGLAALYQPTLPVGEAIDEHLAVLGLRPEDIDCVLISHLDPDHVSGIRHLAGAKRFLMSEEERFWSCRTVYSLREPKELWRNVPIDVFWYKGTPIGPNRWSYDLFGDGSVHLVNVPGHTDGQFAVKVQNGRRFVLLTADAAYSPRSWSELITPGFGFNRQAQLKSLEWIRGEASSPDCVAVLASHDPGLGGEVIEI